MGSIQDLHNGMRLFSKKVGNSRSTVAIYHAMKKLTLQSENKTILTIASEINDLITEKLKEEWNESLTQSKNSIQTHEKSSIANFNKKPLKESEDSILANSSSSSINYQFPSHLYPAGVIYQFWREHKSNKFVTFKLYKTQTQNYGKLEFSPTMLSDHGGAGYRAAFESLLAISVIETKIWISMSSIKRERIREYWNNWSCEDLFDPNADFSSALKQLNRQSKYKKRAHDMGMIRPFLLLVSMSPKRRAAVAKLMGISLVNCYWYCAFDPHKEVWKLISSKKGFISRANGVFKSLNPLASNVNWFDIVLLCCKLVKNFQKSQINKKLLEMLKNISKISKKSFKISQDINAYEISQLEELFMLLLFSFSESINNQNSDSNNSNFMNEDSILDPLAHDSSVEDFESSSVQNFDTTDKFQKVVEKSPINFASIDDIIDNDDFKQSIVHFNDSNLSSSSSSISSVNSSYQMSKSDKKIQDMMIQLRNLGFCTDLFLKYIAKQQIDNSLLQKANEFYTWGTTIRKDDDRIKKKHVAGMVGLGLVSVGLFLTIIPLIHIAPPLAVIPASASVGIGGLFFLLFFIV